MSRNSNPGSSSSPTLSLSSNSEGPANENLQRSLASAPDPKPHPRPTVPPPKGLKKINGGFIAAEFETVILGPRTPRTANSQPAALSPNDEEADYIVIAPPPKKKLNTVQLVRLPHAALLAPPPAISPTNRTTSPPAAFAIKKAVVERRDSTSSNTQNSNINLTSPLPSAASVASSSSQSPSHSRSVSSPTVQSVSRNSNQTTSSSGSAVSLSALPASPKKSTTSAITRTTGIASPPASPSRGSSDGALLSSTTTTTHSQSSVYDPKSPKKSSSLANSMSPASSAREQSSLSPIPSRLSSSGSHDQISNARTRSASSAARPTTSLDTKALPDSNGAKAATSARSSQENSISSSLRTSGPGTPEKGTLSRNKSDEITSAISKEALKSPNSASSSPPSKTGSYLSRTASFKTHRPLVSRRKICLPEIVERMCDPNSGLEIKDRQRGDKRIKRCLVGSELIDWLIHNGITMSGTRQEAIAIATALLNTYIISNNNKLEVFQDSKDQLYQLSDAAMKPLNKTAKKLPQLFGGSLEDIVDAEESNASVPKIYSVLMETIMKNNGSTTEGVFRLSAELPLVAQLRAQLEKRNFTITIRDPHVSANVLKQWLRELKPALIPDLYYYQCIAADRIEDCVRILRKIPDSHYALLKDLIMFLRDFAKHSGETKMGISNLGMIFGPCILRSPSTDANEIMRNSNAEQTFATRLLQEWAPSDEDEW